jgi:hypothetical protein
MAGDWIKLQKDTPDKPEVLAIAARMNLDPDAVVGKLVRIWSWFDTHTIDGNANSVTFALLDRLAGVTGFAEQMTFVGWLDQKGHLLTLPNFEYHNGETAKKRALGKNRQEKRRSNDESNANSNASSVTKALPEKRREEKSIEIQREKATSVATPSGVSDSVWQEFKTLRKAKKAPITQRAIDAITIEANKAGWTLEKALEECVVRGWQAFKSDWVVKPNPADNIRLTVAPSNEPDPALLKIKQDEKITRPPTPEERAILSAYRRKA